MIKLVLTRNFWSRHGALTTGIVDHGDSYQTPTSQSQGIGLVGSCPSRCCWCRMAGRPGRVVGSWGVGCVGWDRHPCVARDAPRLAAPSSTSPSSCQSAGCAVRCRSVGWAGQAAAAVARGGGLPKLHAYLGFAASAARACGSGRRRELAVWPKADDMLVAREVLVPRDADASFPPPRRPPRFRR